MHQRLIKESTIERKHIAALRAEGCMVLKLNVQGTRGWPDVLVVEPNGFVYFIEFKRPKRGRFSKLQSVTIRKLRGMGAMVEVKNDI